MPAGRHLGDGLQRNRQGRDACASKAPLQQLPIDVVKLDRRFVTDLGTDRTGAAMVAAVVGLTEALHLHVIAEGIELPMQAKALTRLGCRLGQGYLFGRPASADTMGAMLASATAAGAARSRRGAA